jgi:hypothetical protein
MTYTATQIDPTDNDSFILTTTQTATSADGKTVSYQNSVPVKVSQIQAKLTNLQNFIKQQQLLVNDLQAQIAPIQTILTATQQTSQAAQLAPQ